MENLPADANAQHPSARGAGVPPVNPGHGAKKKNKNKLKYVALGLAAAILLAVFVVGGWMLYRSSTSAYIDGNKYQAVFFTNGQAYFGKLEKLNGDYFKLTDIFYLEAPAAKGDDPENPQATSSENAPDVQLIKLGNEVHGPDDEMIISKDQILFFENLKTDGKVSDTITKYLNNKK
jgi:hypothetical protein